MRPQEITEKHLLRLNELYAQYFYPPNSTSLPFYITEGLIEKIQKDLENYGSYNPRLGSRWTPHSKLDLRLDQSGNVIGVFEPNFDKHERESSQNECQAALQAGELFSIAVMKLFTETVDE